METELRTDSLQARKRREINGSVLIATALFLAVAFYLPGPRSGVLGRIFLGCSKGLIGPLAYALPPLLLYMALDFFVERRLLRTRRRIVHSVVLLLLATTFVQIFRLRYEDLAPLLNRRYGAGGQTATHLLQSLWLCSVDAGQAQASGVASLGGVLGGLIGLGLQRLIGQVGTTLLLVAALLIELILLFDFSLSLLMKEVSRYFQQQWERQRWAQNWLHRETEDKVDEGGEVYLGASSDLELEPEPQPISDEPRSDDEEDRIRELLERQTAGQQLGDPDLPGGAEGQYPAADYASAEAQLGRWEDSQDVYWGNGAHGFWDLGDLDAGGAKRLSVEEQKQYREDQPWESSAEQGRSLFTDQPIAGYDAGQRTELDLMEGAATADFYPETGTGTAVHEQARLQAADQAAVEAYGPGTSGVQGLPPTTKLSQGAAPGDLEIPSFLREASARSRNAAELEEDLDRILRYTAEEQEDWGQVELDSAEAGPIRQVEGLQLLQNTVAMSSEAGEGKDLAAWTEPQHEGQTGEARPQQVWSPEGLSADAFAAESWTAAVPEQVDSASPALRPSTLDVQQLWELPGAAKDPFKAQQPAAWQPDMGARPSGQVWQEQNSDPEASWNFGAAESLAAPLQSALGSAARLGGATLSGGHMASTAGYKASAELGEEQKQSTARPSWLQPAKKKEAGNAAVDGALLEAAVTDPGSVDGTVDRDTSQPSGLAEAREAWPSDPQDQGTGTSGQTGAKIPRSAGTSDPRFSEGQVTRGQDTATAKSVPPGHALSSSRGTEGLAASKAAETGRKPGLPEARSYVFREHEGGPQARLQQQEFPREDGAEAAYVLPPLALLQPENHSGDAGRSREIQKLAERLKQTLENFRVEARIVDITTGPTITRFELAPGPGVKVSKIVNMKDDIALSLAAAGMRVEAPIPGKSAIGFEIPNRHKSPVNLRGLIESAEFRRAKPLLTAALGRDIAGAPILLDIADMPHLLIAGATGSGKSVCINAILLSLLYRAKPSELKLLMIDPKVVELSVYNGIPHLLAPVVTDPQKAANTLNWAVVEMLRRYELFAEASVRDFKGYNMHAQQRGLDKLPYIVIVIDELADLMMTASAEVEGAISRLTALARAAGIHLIIATQRPSVDVITGIIKANIPKRIAFAVSSQVDSRTIIDMVGADQLLGKGDMLYPVKDSSKPQRGQGAFVSNHEVEAVVSYIQAQGLKGYDEALAEQIVNTDSEASSPGGSGKNSSQEDELFDEAVELILDTGMASVSTLQRRLSLGHPRAGRLMDALEKAGIVGPQAGSKPRKILISRAQWEVRKAQELNDI